MPNITLSLAEDVYRKMKRRTDVKWSEVASRAKDERLERLEGPVAFRASTSDLRDKIAKSGVDLEKVPVEHAIRQYRKAKKLEWKRTSTIHAN